MQKTVLITGTSTGIGRATAFHFAKNNWNVIATMRKPKDETELINFSNVLVTALDVTDPDSIQDAINEGIVKFGGIDVLVNNAGYGQQGLFEATSTEKVKEQFDTNVFGIMNVTRAILPHFRKRQSGTIINLSSAVGIVGTPMMSLYSASKFAIEGFSEALSYELISQNINVKLIEPGVIKTSFYKRVTEELAVPDETLSDYQKFSDDMAAFFSSSQGAENQFAAEDVAGIIFEAAHDQSSRLRYVAGPDVEPLIEMKKALSDDEYLQTIRNIFYPGGFTN